MTIGRSAKGRMICLHYPRSRHADAPSEDLPAINPFLESSERFFIALKPGTNALAETAPVLDAAQVAGIPVLRESPAFNAQLEPTADALLAFQEAPGVFNGLDLLIDTNETLNPAIKFIGPAQTTCNYLTLAFRNVSSAFSPNNGRSSWLRALSFQAPEGPNSEGGFASAPANGGGEKASLNHLHTNPYPNTAAPGQPKECEAGNEGYLNGKTVIGNVPGNQGTGTEGQKSGYEG